ncbi:clavesin-1-like isoform X7 [Uranotaenia lowii]|uniref:clavesin-1-like isoform X7 n=1 Tax=Uranotaenia lowii TaxID=190385 RepID=UPI002478A463|nr:clavesin-1-like isoform X7 [Uranotaenia lowii]
MEQDYRTTLEPRFLAIAREELHEDETTREPALRQMREFINKHPQIKYCRTDALFLLRFLRYRKFNVVAACEMLEKWLTAGSLTASFFRFADPRDLDYMIDECMIIPVERDRQDRLIVIVRFGAFDPSKIIPEDQTRLGTLTMETFHDEEMYQITGIVALLDFSGATMAHFAIWTIPKLQVLIGAVNDLMTFRIREIHVVQLPKYASVLMEFCMAALSPKLQKRLKFHKSIDDLKAAIDESVLPDIYGGKQSLEEANERFRQKVLEQRERILKHAEMTIDLSIPNPNSKNPANAALQSSVVDESVIGSFRKLNVD